MIKILFRTLMILMAAALVVGGTYLVYNTGEASVVGGRPDGEGHGAQGAEAGFDFDANRASSGGRGAGFSEGERPGEGQQSILASLSSFLKTLIPVALIITAINVVRWLFKRIKKNRVPQTTVAL